MKRASAKKRIGGVQFMCVRPGLWVSYDQRYAIVELRDGTPEHEQRNVGVVTKHVNVGPNDERYEWCLFRTARHADPTLKRHNIDDPRIASADFWSGVQLVQCRTMGDLDVSVAAEVLTEEQIERVRRALIGMPRKTAGDRALIRDCDAAFGGGPTANREAVALVWLAMNSPAGWRKGVHIGDE